MIGRPVSRQQFAHEGKYDPRLCKTCQDLGLPRPRIARKMYSDCEYHYLERLDRMHLSIEIKPAKKRRIRFR